MELAARTLSRPRALAIPVLPDRRVAGAWILGFAPVLYLTLRGGGYDLLVHSEVGLVAWWIVLLGALAGVLPLSKPSKLAYVAVVLLSAFALWSLISTGWSSSEERTVAEVGRIATYGGFFVLALAVLRRDTIRPLVAGVAVAFGIASLLAVLSRLYPAAFPADQTSHFFFRTTRLAYPLNYANGTGNFLAIGIPLLLALATRARTLIAQGLAAAAVPVAVLGVVLAASRGGVLTSIVGIAVFYALAPDRIPKLLSGLAVAAGSAILVVALLHRHALRDALTSSAAVSQRHQVMALLVVVCAAVALIQVGIGLATRYGIRPPPLRISKIDAIRGSAITLLLALVVAIAAGVPGKLKHQWDLFKRIDTTGVVSRNEYSRLETASGSHRYQYWSTAGKAFDSKPVNGIGSGTFEFYWAQHSPFYEFVRNAHSLYIETLAETGLTGFIPLAALLIGLLAIGTVRALRAPPLPRTALAAATASLAGFCAAAAWDWIWQLPVMPVAAMLLGAAILAYGHDRRAERHPWALRGGIALLALAALVAIAIPYAATSSIRSSQDNFRSNNLSQALSDAESAQSLEPYAATPRLQEALVFEQAGDLNAAGSAITAATRREPQNWRLWVVKARIDAESKRPVTAVRDFQLAHALNPRSPETAIPQ